MKKILFLSFLVISVLSSRTADAQPSVSPKSLESFIRRMCPMTNDPEGAELERRFNITEFRDGKWTCDDRAELAMRFAGQYGYQTTYEIDKTSDPKVFHRYITVQDEEGSKATILRLRRWAAED